MSTFPSTKIDENAIKAWRISAFLYVLPLYALPALFYFMYVTGNGFPVLISIISAPVTVIIHLILTVIFPKIRWKRWAYEVNEQGVDMMRGIIVRKRTMVPINRVQHVDTKQGPIYRKYGLSSISLSTAATTHEIPALDDQTANELRNLISELVRKVKEDV